VTLDTPLALADLVPRLRQRQLERLGLVTASQVLSHFPRRYEDRRQFERFPTDSSETAVCLCGVVKKVQVRRIRGWQKMVDVLLEEENVDAFGGRLLLRWFNAHWVEKSIIQGQRLVVYGKPKLSGNQVIIAHPDFEVIEEDDDVTIHLRRIVPVHPAGEGISARVLRRVVWDVLARVNPSEIEQLLPARLDRMSRWEALRQIHFPDSWETLAQARKHLVLEEFLGMQLAVGLKRQEQQSQVGEVHGSSGELFGQLVASLPFPLTGAQNRAIAEIRQDLASTRPMSRLLHGDVGAGKTLVALAAMLLCVEGGFQAALMAPTQILAEQHYATFRRLLDPLGIRVALRTGARAASTPDLPLFASAPQGVEPVPGFGNLPHIVLGTHALLYDGSEFAKLGLAVIDEQHKFGVMQRARLREKGVAPDVLVMTATPIPRTLTMTVYGDLDVSTLDEVPQGRGKIITGIRSAKKLPDAAKFLREQIEAGRQCYIVYPLVEESEKSEAKAATAEFAKWSEMLAPAKCELLHGRVPPDEKDAIMERFRRKETHALIATTVIEVGIDVPNATVMLIENAERFGLAQLHQLRGRIGRGGHKSYCILVPTSDDPEMIEKLKVMEETSNGFEIAEADLRLRGPGDLLGTAQSGLPPLKIGDLFRDADLMKLARNHAFLVFERDPQLEHPEHAGCRTLLVNARQAILSDVS
jgi:ATP-dependent DNA helicase RecG